MSKLQLQFAAWVAATSAALTIPLFAFQTVAARTGPTLLTIAIQLTNVLLFMYVLSSLRALLAQKELPRANGYITAVIGVTVSVQLMALFATTLPVLALPIFAGLVVLGILYVVTGIKLLDYAPRLSGLKLVSYAAILVGVCTASIVLALLVLPASMLLDIGLAIVFFREAGRPEAAIGTRLDDKLAG